MVSTLQRTVFPCSLDLNFEVSPERFQSMIHKR